VFASGLTIVECERVLIRRTFLGEFTEADAASRLARLTAAASRWTVLHVAEPVLDRARRAFPSEPVRTLDAIHLSSALAARAAVPDVAILALDEAIRRNGTALGFTVLPTT
jgi:predicted nucleic acid-binding protein